MSHLPRSRVGRNAQDYTTLLSQNLQFYQQMYLQEIETHNDLEGPNLLIITEGKGRVVWSGGDLTVKESSVLFVGANTKVTFEANESLMFFRAFVEVWTTSYNVAPVLA